MAPRQQLALALALAMVACAAGASTDMRRSLRAVVSNNLGATARNLQVPLVATRAFLSGLDGTVLLNGDGKYAGAVNYQEAISKVYNRYRRPSIVVQATSEADVRETVAFAAAHKLPLCVRAGGHDVSGASLCNGVLLMLEKMNKVVVNKAKMEFVAQAGTRFQKILDVLEGQGMSAVTGSCPTVGLAGYSMGGGWGWLSKQHGLGLDNVLSYRVVLADGKVVEASKTAEPELFWALRGAGHGNFGVVTSIKYRALPGKQRSDVLAYAAHFDMAKNPQLAAQALALWSDKFVGGTSSRLLTIQPNIITDLRSGVRRLVLDAVYFGRGPNAGAELRKLVAPIQALKPQKGLFKKVKTADLSSEDSDSMTYELSVDQGGDPDNEWSAKRGEYAAAPMTVAQWRKIVDSVSTMPAYGPGYKHPAATQTYFEAYEGAITDVPSDATAFVHRQRGFTIVVETMFQPVPGAREAALKWLSKLYDTQWAGLLSGGAYQNYPSDAYSASTAWRKYYGSNLCRLVKAKARYDPRNVFGPSQPQGLPTSLAGC